MLLPSIPAESVVFTQLLQFFYKQLCVFCRLGALVQNIADFHRFIVFSFQRNGNNLRAVQIAGYNARTDCVAVKPDQEIEQSSPVRNMYNLFAAYGT